MVRTINDELMEKDLKWETKWFLERQKKREEEAIARGEYVEPIALSTMPRVAPGARRTASLGTSVQERPPTSASRASRGSRAASVTDLRSPQAGPLVLTRRIQHRRKKCGGLYDDAPMWRQGFA
mmetsp:Transcript_22146/g.48982  ORF Transcript_22146/g.48982 Transcript_22146/m.48982 type:complete len:124 (-) Transcript_22146:135-506(-)|eukprot:CAMPEP_0170626270 /NCGR_PEP_ID=MMETSP0224-20130122/31261_1 /TAXON_ID=285029 /ORGANISM="Togula jolla, Strain CCCM 725" /LENGTH=123 /DNA_ID=CAMNT_0010953017 /DNA_START=22 /DNA_END=393 /DNA_ORIENTATION=+